MVYFQSNSGSDDKWIQENYKFFNTCQKGSFTTSYSSTTYMIWLTSLHEIIQQHGVTYYKFIMVYQKNICPFHFWVGPHILNKVHSVHLACGEMSLCNLLYCIHFLNPFLIHDATQSPCGLALYDFCIGGYQSWWYQCSWLSFCFSTWSSFMAIVLFVDLPMEGCWVWEPDHEVF